MKRYVRERAYLVRVGGLFALVGCAILLAKLFYPGYEAIASAAVCLTVAIVAIVNHVRRRRRQLRNAKSRAP